ncbi:MAG TPA: DUF4214 domain-containing protein, partial [Blastocatellia bacterium]|nr:DUF4214 domain-containing protein [Blastocatellia bacterium]
MSLKKMSLKKRLLVIGAAITVLAGGSGLIASVWSAKTDPAGQPGRQSASGVKTSADPRIAPASLSASIPSKELVYAGGQLIATEEPISQGCTLSASASPTSFAFWNGTTADPLPGTLTVTASGSCNWTATSNVQWLHINASGTSSGQFPFTVDPNWTNSCRSGAISIGTQLVSIKQAGSVTADSDCDGVPDSVEPAEGLNPNIKDNNVFTSARLFVMQQYRDILGREGDAGGITFWANWINSGNPRALLVDTFLRTAEFDNSVGAVDRLYRAYFLRRPDYGGIQFWVRSYRLGTPLNSISDAFAASQEFTSTYGSLNNTQFVTLVYNNVLNRPPDPGGLAFWVGQLDSGAKTRGQVMLGFSDSTEYRNLIFNKVYVEQAYMCLLRRKVLPETGGEYD